MNRSTSITRAVISVMLIAGSPFALEMKTSALIPQPKPVLEFFVGTNGDDRWDGSSPVANGNGIGPLRTLEGARDRVRDLKGRGPLPIGGVAVTVLAGLHEREKTLELGATDSGTAGSPILWRGQGGRTHLVGGKAIRGWKTFRGPLLQVRLNPTDFPHPFRQLFFNGKRQPMARYPNFDPQNPYGGGWAYVAGSMADTEKPVSRNGFKIRPEDLRPWAPGEAEVNIFPGPNYRNNLLPLQGVNRESHIYDLGKDSDYPFRPMDRYFVQGPLEELDAPGEWHLAKDGVTLTFWPPAPLEGAEVLAPSLGRLIDVNGASHLEFRGFTLECAEDAAFLFTNATDCLLSGSVIRNVVGSPSGMGAVVIVGGNRVGVVGCDLSDIGTTAIHMAGGDRRELIPGGHFAENNYIHHVGTVYARGVGLNIDGVGQRASHNLIHDCPRFALIFYGNDHRIEWNRLRHMNIQTEDTGATYCWGRDFLTSRGSVIAWNHVSDSLGYGKKGDQWVSPYYAWGIYLDDDCAGVDVIGNLVVNANRAGIHFHNARDIVASNNVFVNNGAHDIEMNGWNATHKYFLQNLSNMEASWHAYAGLPAWRKYRGLWKAPPAEAGFMVDNLITKNILYSTNAAANAYSIRNFTAARTTIDSNLVWHGEPNPRVQGVKAEADRQWQAWKDLGMDTHSLVSDPGFVDAARGDYRLKPDSPARALGIASLPLEHVGPYADARRATWPIVEAPGVREFPVTAPASPVIAATGKAQVVVPRAPLVKVDGLMPTNEYPGRRVPVSKTAKGGDLGGASCDLAVSHDGKNLHIAVKVPIARMSELKNGSAWGTDDGLELALAPITEGTVNDDCHLLRGMAGGTTAASPEGGIRGDRMASFTFKARPYGNLWVGEFEIPFKDLGINGAPGVQIGFQVSVYRSQNREWAHWVGGDGKNRWSNRGTLVLE